MLLKWSLNVVLLLLNVFLLEASIVTVTMTLN